MKLYDQHIHTFLSSDSSESFENYLNLAHKLGHTHFVTTEHLDLSCLSLGYDDLPDLRAQDNIIKTIKKYPIHILKGVELGYKRSRLADIKEIVERENFDVVIMSVHESHEAECVSAEFLKDLSSDEAYSAYLDIYHEILNTCDFYDIVGHLDFLLRYIDKVALKNHEKQLSNLLRQIIEQNKCLEFNTRFLYRQNDGTYLQYIFELYFALGGRKISLGSDAHSALDFMGGFGKAIEMLKSIGFNYLTFFQERQEIKFTL